MSEITVTQYGLEKIAAAAKNGTPLNATAMVIGDGPPTSIGIGGNTVYTIPSPTISIDPGNPNRIVASGTIPHDTQTSFVVGSIALMDNANAIAIAEGSGNIKHGLDHSHPQAYEIELVINLSNDVGITEAPQDGKLYGRKDAAWEEVPDGGGSGDVTQQDLTEAVANLAPINSPTFTGEPTAPTPDLEDNSAQIATTEYVRAVASEVEAWVTENFAEGGGGGGNGGGGGDGNGGGDSGGEPPAPTGTIMGARWFKNASPTALARLHDAVGLNFTPAVSGVGGSSDFDTMPVYSAIRLCNVVNGVVTAYYGEPGFTRNPSFGDVMVEIPRYYYKIVEGLDTRDYLISDVQHDNTWQVSPRHAPTADNPAGWEKIYVSAYTLDSNYRSVSGAQSAMDMTRATARTNIHNRGSNYWQYDYATYWTINLLYLVEVADWDSQAAVGQGSVNNAPINTGGTDNIAFHSGATVAAGVQTGLVKYRNVENLWGNIWQWVDGININDRIAYLSLVPSQYNDDTANGYTALSYTNAAISGEFIKRLGFDVNFPFAQICVEGGGADGTFVPDRYYSDGGWRVLLVGGGWLGGADAGLFLSSASGASSGVSPGAGRRLLVLP
jgi:hypothetical protein